MIGEPILEAKTNRIDYRSELVTPQGYLALKPSLPVNGLGLRKITFLAGTMYGDARRQVAKYMNRYRDRAIDPDVKQWSPADAAPEVDGLNNSSVVTFLLNGDVHVPEEVDPKREKELQTPEDVGAASLAELSLALTMVPFKGQKLIIYISPSYLSRLQDPLLRGMYLQIIKEAKQLQQTHPYSSLIEIYEGSSLDQVAHAIETSIDEQERIAAELDAKHTDKTRPKKTPAEVNRINFGQRAMDQQDSLLHPDHEIAILSAGSGGPSLPRYKDPFDAADQAGDDLFESSPEIRYYDTNEVNEDRWNSLYQQMTEIGRSADTIADTFAEAEALLAEEDELQNKSDFFFSRISKYSLSMNAVIRNNLMLRRAIDQGKPMVTLVEQFDPLAYIRDYISETLGGKTNLNDEDYVGIAYAMGLEISSETDYFSSFCSIIDGLLSEDSSISFKTFVKNTNSIPGLDTCRLVKRADSASRVRSTHIAQLEAISAEYPEMVYLAKDEQDYLQKLEQYSAMYKSIAAIKSNSVGSKIISAANTAIPGLNFDDSGRVIAIPAFRNDLTALIARQLVPAMKKEVERLVAGLNAASSKMLSPSLKTQLIRMIDEQLEKVFASARESLSQRLATINDRANPEYGLISHLIELWGDGYLAGETSYAGANTIKETYSLLNSLITQQTKDRRIPDSDLLVAKDFEYSDEMVVTMVEKLSNKIYPGYENLPMLTEAEFEDWYNGTGDYQTPQDLRLLATKYPGAVRLEHPNVPENRRFTLEEYIQKWESVPEERRLPKKILKALWTKRGLLIGNGWYWEVDENEIVDIFLPVFQTETGGLQSLWTLSVTRSDPGMEGTIAPIGGMNESQAQRMGLIEILEETGMTMRQVLELIANDPADLVSLEYLIDYAPEDLKFPDWINIIKLKESQDPDPETRANDIELATEIEKQLDIIIERLSQKMFSFGCGTAPIADVRMTGTSFPRGEIQLLMPSNAEFAAKFPTIDWSKFEGQTGETMGVQLVRVDQALFDRIEAGNIPGHAIQLRRAIKEFSKITGFSVDKDGYLGRAA